MKMRLDKEQREAIGSRLKEVRLFNKLNVGGRTEAVAEGVRKGIIKL